MRTHVPITIERVGGHLVLAAQSAHWVNNSGFEFRDYHRAEILQATPEGVATIAAVLWAMKDRVRVGDMHGEPGLFSNPTPPLAIAQLGFDNAISFAKKVSKFVIVGVEISTREFTFSPMRRVRGPRWDPDTTRGTPCATFLLEDAAGIRDYIIEVCDL
ncbi:MAG: hypothetical protein V4735_03435 [Pseudomonadota bacterium]